MGTHLCIYLFNPLMPTILPKSEKADFFTIYYWTLKDVRNNFSRLFLFFEVGEIRTYKNERTGTYSSQYIYVCTGTQGWNVSEPFSAKLYEYLFSPSIVYPIA